MLHRREWLNVLGIALKQISLHQQKAAWGADWRASHAERPNFRRHPEIQKFGIYRLNSIRGFVPRLECWDRPQRKVVVETAKIGALGRLPLSNVLHCQIGDAARARSFCASTGCTSTNPLFPHTDA